MISRFALVGAALLSACATVQAPEAQPAALSELTSAHRDLIRTYVRDLLGPDYLVDLESLTQSGSAKATDRRAGDPYREGYIPKPTVNFALFLTGQGNAQRCELRPQSIGGEPLILDARNCTIMETDEVVVVTG